jgi:hypothetical protein
VSLRLIISEATVFGPHNPDSKIVDPKGERVQTPRFGVGLLTIRFSSGDAWEVEVAKVHHGPARKLVEVLTAAAAAV